MSLRTATCNLLSHAVACCDKANKSQLCSSHQTKVSIKCETGKRLSQTILLAHVCSDLYIDYFFETSGTASCGTTGNIYNPTKNTGRCPACIVDASYVHKSRYFLTSTAFLTFHVPPRSVDGFQRGRSHTQRAHGLQQCDANHSDGAVEGETGKRGNGGGKVMITHKVGPLL